MNVSWNIEPNFFYGAGTVTIPTVQSVDPSSLTLDDVPF